VTLVLEALHGEASELVRKAFDSAKAGNGPMLRFFLGILLPKGKHSPRTADSVKHNS
jgi:hypothetical protein